MSQIRLVLDEHCQDSRRECSAGPSLWDDKCSLWRRFVDQRNLSFAWDRVSTNTGANTPGPDGIIADAIKPIYTAWLKRLVAELQNGHYRPASPRIVRVPKAPGQGERILGILNLADRVVHTALKQVLEPILEPVFLDASFGFRPGRSVPLALRTVLRHLRSHQDAQNRSGPSPYHRGEHGRGGLLRDNRP